MSESADDVAAGRAAWERIREDARATWQDWLTIGRALAIGRTAALKAADTNRCVGTRYNKAMGSWLRENGLDGISGPERYRIGLVLENLPAIETWRGSMDEALRRRLNHPSAIWAHWRQATRPPTPPRRRQDVAAEARRGRSIYWPQHALRRAHEAMLRSRSTDLLTLARIALQAAIRSESDLIELLPPSSVGMSASARRTDVVSAVG